MQNIFLARGNIKLIKEIPEHFIVTIFFLYILIGIVISYFPVLIDKSIMKGGIYELKSIYFNMQA